MQTREERTVALALRDRVKEEYGMTRGESDRWCAWVDLWNLDEKALKGLIYLLGEPDSILFDEEGALIVEVEKSLPANRNVTITPIKEPPLQPGQNKSKSVFDRHQPELTA